MPSKRKPAAKKSSSKSKTRKAPAKRKTSRSRPSGPLVDVARKIGTTLGEVAVRTGIVKPASAPAGEGDAGGNERDGE